MLKPFLMLATLSLAALPFATQEPAQTPASGAAPAAAGTAYAIPPADAQKTNPVKPTAESQNRAKQIWGYDCALCHGEKGDGNGDIANQMKAKMLNYHDPAALKSYTDGELYYMIMKGKGQMPPEEGRAKPDEVWNLVIYLRAMAKQ